MYPAAPAAVRVNTVPRNRASLLFMRKISAIPLDPAVAVLHYAQEIFEGLKAYKRDNGVNLFRPDANARRFRDSADRMAMALVHARRNKSHMAVVYLDLDGFKQINDTLGHGAGDSVLKMVAGRLQATVRAADTVARLGGDEFIIVLQHVSSRDDAGRVAAKVIEAVAQPYSVEDQPVHITISAGIAIYPLHGEDADTLMKNADAALYQAKRAGKNVYRIAEHTASMIPPAGSEPLRDASW